MSKPIKVIDFTPYNTNGEVMTLVLKTIQDLTLMQLGDSLKVVLKDREFVLKKTEETVSEKIEVAR